MKFSKPCPTAQAHSDELFVVINERIKNNGGQITFAEYMQLALYVPGLGYYAAGAHKLGAGGDFITAPEISPLFSYCLARQCQDVLNKLNGGDILEFGAGSGVMAKDILLYLQQQNSLPAHYYILEVSPDLQERQRDLLERECPTLLTRVQWLRQLPQPGFKGVILANEVLDAMPVHIFYRTETEVLEKYVTLENNQFAWRNHTASDPRLVEKVLQLEQQRGIPFAPGYCSEINLLADGWIQSIADFFQQGLILLIDYGFLRQEYYHPDRHMGTLMCHYQHQAHIDPLILPGLQDITAHVDFSAVGDVAEHAGLSVVDFTTQARFLLGMGLTDFVTSTQPEDVAGSYNIVQQIKQLTMPQEMGELFKVMVLGKNFHN